MTAIKSNILKSASCMYLASLFTPAIRLSDGEQYAGIMYGYNVLLFGWSNHFQILGTVEQLTSGWLSLSELFAIHTWFANPLTWVAFFTFAAQRFYATIIFSTLSLALMINYLFTDECYCNPDLIQYFLSPHIGYYLWLVSCGLLLVGSVYEEHFRHT